MPDQPTSAPTDKVTAATIGAAVAVILAWVLEIATGVDIPAFVGGALAVVLTFLFGYLKTEQRGYTGRHVAE